MLSDNTEMQKRKENELWVSGENLKKLKTVIGKVLEMKRNLTDLSVHVDKRVLELIPEYFAGTLPGKALKCYEGFTRIVIIFDGDLWTCQGIYGNLKNSSLEKAWFSKKAGNIRAKVDLCRAHCLQSCVHLTELSDIFSSSNGFISSIKEAKEKKKYLRRLLNTFKRYQLLLMARLWIQGFKNIFRRGERLSKKNLKCEMLKIGEAIKRIKHAGKQ